MARIITSLGVREVSDKTFFESFFGTAEQRAERDRKDLERHIQAIERGNEWAVPPPYLAECRRIIAEREAGECGSDPLRHIEPRARRVA